MTGLTMDRCTQTQENIDEGQFSNIMTRGVQVLFRNGTVEETKQQ